MGMTVPLSVVVGLMTVAISVTATGAFWVSKVNDRLGRIEQRLGIAAIPGSPGEVASR